MFLKELKLQGFRNFSDRVFSFPNERTVIIAPNGSGKTNILESIYYLATGMSFRTQKYKESIGWGSDLARIEGMVDERELSVVLQKTKKRFFLNKKEISYQSFLSYIYAVSFQPTDLNLLSGSPRVRRQFIDRMLAQMDFEYLHALLSFQRLLLRKNKLLKNDPAYINNTLLDSLESQLVTYAETIITARANVFSRINEGLLEKGIKVRYSPSPHVLRELCENPAGITAGNIAGIMQEKMRENRDKEVLLGFSLFGPQRDDFVVFGYDEAYTEHWKDLALYGSRGQQRVAVIHLKLIERELLMREKTNNVVMLLDDVFSELDEANSVKLLEFLSGTPVVITTTELPKKLQELFPQGTRLNLREI